jgi:superfamily II DNA or RNA helicase
LRPYQQEALAAIEAAAAHGIRRAVLVLATRLGKTIVFSGLIRRQTGRALVLVHRDELVRQAVEKLGLVAPFTEVGIVKAWQDEVEASVVVVSVQTLARETLLRGVRPDITIVVVDEAHQLAAETYQRVLEHLGVGAEASPLSLGVTATPQRGDEAARYIGQRGAVLHPLEGLSQRLCPRLGLLIETERAEAG